MEKAKKAVVPKGRTVSEQRSVLIKIFATAIISFGASFGKLIGFPSYMNVVCAALSGNFIIPSFLGSCLQYALFGTFEGGIVQLCSILCVAALRAVNPFGERRDDPMLLSLTVTGSIMLFGSVMSISQGSDAYTTSLRMIGALMCGCTVYAARTLILSYRRNGTIEVGGINGAFLGIVCVSVISALTSVPLFSLNLGRIVGVFILLHGVKKYRNIGGAAIGALTACGVLLCEPLLARNTLLLATAGLICGAFAGFGTLVTVLIFLGVSLLGLVAVGVNSDTFHMFADLAVGSVLFIVLPMPRISKTLKKFFCCSNSLDLVGQTTSSKLSYAGNALGGIRRQLSEITDAMDRKISDRCAAEDVKKYLCGECERCHICYGGETRTDIGLSRLESIAEKYSGISEDDVKSCLKCCVKPRLMQKTFSEIYDNLLSDKADNIRIKELRELLTEQLSSMEDILVDLSFRTSQVRSIDPKLSAAVRDYFGNLGYPNTKACVYSDENLCMHADIYLTADFVGDTVKTTAAVSSVLDCDMGLPTIAREDRLVRISFTELPAYVAQTAAFTASAGGEYSGDSYEIFDLNGCEKYVALSDGMGTGKRARLDSVFTVRLAEKLICSGLSMKTAHRLINSVLRVKGWEESFATLDLLRIDLNGGTGRFLKSGAPMSVLCRDGCVKYIGGQAFPAGIFAECLPDVCEVKLFDGDIILMFSDGVDEESAERISRMAAMGGDLEKLTLKMGRYVLEKNGEENKDDITIVSIKIKNNLEKC